MFCAIFILSTSVSPTLFGSDIGTRILTISFSVPSIVRFTIVSISIVLSSSSTTKSIKAFSLDTSYAWSTSTTLSSDGLSIIFILSRTTFCTEAVFATFRTLTA